MKVKKLIDIFGDRPDKITYEVEGRSGEIKEITTMCDYNRIKDYRVVDWIIYPLNIEIPSFELRIVVEW